MGAFNRLLTRVECSNCHRSVQKAIQFKYGERWQYDYTIGDRLVWGGGDNDTGKPEVARVRVAAIAEPCPACDSLGDGPRGEEWYDVIIERDTIAGVRYLANGEPDYFYAVEDE